MSNSQKVCKTQFLLTYKVDTEDTTRLFASYSGHYMVTGQKVRFPLVLDKMAPILFKKEHHWKTKQRVTIEFRTCSVYQAPLYFEKQKCCIFRHLWKKSFSAFLCKKLKKCKKKRRKSNKFVANFSKKTGVLSWHLNTGKVFYSQL